MGKMITVAEAAERLGLAPPTVYGMIDDGRLPAYRLGRSVRVDEDEMETWKHAQRVKPSPPKPPIKRPPGRPKGSTRKNKDPRWHDAPADQIYTGLQCLSRFRT